MPVLCALGIGRKLEGESSVGGPLPLFFVLWRLDLEGRKEDKRKCSFKEQVGQLRIGPVSLLYVKAYWPLQITSEWLNARFASQSERN